MIFFRPLTLFCECLHDYSDLNATIGSKFDAFHAGQNPKNTPTAAENAVAITTEFIEIIAGNGRNDDAK